LATPNYGYEKRQKELAKKRKKEEKLKSKSERKTTGDPLGADEPEDAANAAPQGSPGPDAGAVNT
jgi:hypothetical protein